MKTFWKADLIDLEVLQQKQTSEGSYAPTYMERPVWARTVAPEVGVVLRLQGLVESKMDSMGLDINIPVFLWQFLPAIFFLQNMRMSIHLHLIK